MTTNLYVCKDSVSNKVLCGFICANDGLAVRDNVVALSKVAPLGDLQLFRVATIDDSSMLVEYTTPVLVPWDSYRFPENPLKKDIELANSKNEVSK